MSNRQRKKYINQEVNRLRKKPGWDPHNQTKTSPLEQLQRLDQELQSERAYTEASTCNACLRAQQKTGDTSALCEEHITQALGF